MGTDSRAVSSPAGYVPSMAISFGRETESAVAVDARNPLPVADACFTASAAINPGDTVTSGRALMAVCTSPGDLALRLADSNVLTIPLAAGLSILPFAVIQVVTAGTTATASYRNLF